MLRQITRLEFVPASDDSASDELTVWFSDTGDEPFSPSEYRNGTPTRVILDMIHYALINLVYCGNFSLKDTQEHADDC